MRTAFRTSPLRTCSSNSVTVLLGNGSGGFTPPAGSPFTVGSQPNTVAVGDFNSAGIPDLVTSNGGSNDVSVLLGNGSGRIYAGPRQPVCGGKQSFVGVGGGF